VTSPTLQVRHTTIPEVKVLVPKVFGDKRGFFLETFNRKIFTELGLPSEFVQDNHSRSSNGVLRGLHYQLTKPQGKLVRVARGRVFDVAADIRRGSPTFGKWVGVILDDSNLSSLWIPPGFAHGYCALADEVDVTYKCTELYAPSDERGIIWNDSTLMIDWPVSKPVVSAKDAAFPKLVEADDLPTYNAD
jgi:dTDP-4-dehydrorhamnose 3,5-epimerase